MITKKETTVIYEKKNGEYKEQVILYDKALIRCLKELRKK